MLPGFVEAVFFFVPVVFFEFAFALEVPMLEAALRGFFADAVLDVDAFFFDFNAAALRFVDAVAFFAVVFRFFFALLRFVFFPDFTVAMQINPALN